MSGQAYVGSLEVPYEGIPELGPAVDPPHGRCSSQVRAESARYSGMLLMMKRSLVAPLSVRNMVPTLTSNKRRGLSLDGRC
jgi:hypothetical protein